MFVIDVIFKYFCKYKIRYVFKDNAYLFVIVLFVVERPTDRLKHEIRVLNIQHIVNTNEADVRVHFNKKKL